MNQRLNQGFHPKSTRALLIRFSSFKFLALGLHMVSICLEGPLFSYKPFFPSRNLFESGQPIRSPHPPERFKHPFQDLIGEVLSQRYPWIRLIPKSGSVFSKLSNLNLAPPETTSPAWLSAALACAVCLWYRPPPPPNVGGWFSCGLLFSNPPPKKKHTHTHYQFQNQLSRPISTVQVAQIPMRHCSEPTRKGSQGSPLIRM